MRVLAQKYRFHSAKAFVCTAKEMFKSTSLNRNQNDGDYNVGPNTKHRFYIVKMFIAFEFWSRHSSWSLKFFNWTTSLQKMEEMFSMFFFFFFRMKFHGVVKSVGKLVYLSKLDFYDEAPQHKRSWHGNSCQWFVYKVSC